MPPAEVCPERENVGFPDPQKLVPPVVVIEPAVGVPEQLPDTTVKVAFGL